MSPIALNTLAIAIFSMTMLSLLGPIFQISPWVPATLTLGLLSVTTLDTLQWRGQGLTLLLNAIALQSPAYQERVVRHEAGHFLVAHVLGIPVTYYALSAWEAFRQGHVAQGGVGFDEDVIQTDIALLQGYRLNPEKQQILNRYIRVWMAGIAAEELLGGEVMGGAEDRARVAEVLQAMGYSNEAILTQQRWGIQQARVLLTQHQAAYAALCAAMTERKPVADCQEILGSLLSISTDL